MREKQLTEAAWKAFSSKTSDDYKDAPLLRVLAALAAAQKAGSGKEIEALTDVDKQVDALRKAHKAERALVSQLDDMDKTPRRQRKACERALKDAANDNAGDDDEDSPTLLSSKLIPLLCELRKGETVMPALVLVSGKDAAVLVSRRAISPTRGKLLKEYLKVSVSVKLIKADCRFEINAHTFVVHGEPAAKKLRATLLAQTDMKLKVRVRGQDHNDIDEDGDPDEGEDGLGLEDIGTNTAQQSEVPQAPPPPPDPLKGQFDKRWAELEKRVLENLRNGVGDASKQLAVAEFVREKGDAGNYKAALQGMDSLEKLLAALVAPTSSQKTDGNTTPDKNPAGAFNERLAALMPSAGTAIAAGGEKATDIKLKISEAGVFARKKDFAQANALLCETESHIGEASEPGTDAPDENEQDEDQTQETTGGPREEYEALYERLLPDYESAMQGSDPALAEQLGAVRRAWEMATETFEAGNVERAPLVLKRIADGGALAKLLGACTSTAGNRPRGKIVAQRKFILMRWAKVPTELDEMSGVVDQEGGGESPAELAQTISELLDELLDEIQDQIDDAIDAGDMRVYKELKGRVEQDPLIKHLDKAPFTDGSKFKRAVLTAMDEIETRLAA